MGNRVLVALSGSGRTLQNLVDRQSADSYQVVGVVTSNPNCRGNAVARQLALPLLAWDFSRTTPQQTTAAVYEFAAGVSANWIALAGFLKPWPVHADWAGHIVNIHPALLPKFGGKGMYGNRVHAAVLQAGEVQSGATVHLVNERYDEGGILAQIVVPVLSNDEVDKLAARVFAAECELYPEVLKKLVAGDLPLPDGGVWHYESNK